MKREGLIRALLFGVLVTAAIVVSVRFDLPTLLRGLLDWIAAQGIVGILVFVGTYIAATVLFVPGSILTLGGGFVFGVLGGTVAVSVASTVGATCAFLVGRYIARSWVASRTAGNPRFQAIDEAVAREGWKIVLLTRLSPVFPFNLLNYAYGLTGVGLGGYLLASWIGMLPGTVMYVYFGSVAASIATLGSGGASGPVQWILYGLGFLATLGVTVFVTRLARRALQDALVDPGSGSDRESDPADLPEDAGNQPTGEVL